MPLTIPKEEKSSLSHNANLLFGSLITQHVAKSPPFHAFMDIIKIFNAPINCYNLMTAAFSSYFIRYFTASVVLFCHPMNKTT